MNHKRIKIIFDAVPLSQEKPTGVGRAEAGLITALAHNYPDELELVGHYFDFMGRKKRNGEKGTLVEAPNIRYKRTTVLPGKVFNMLRRMKLPIPYELLVKERGDFHLFPNFLGWPSIFSTPSSPYIHDATYIDTPEYVNGPNLFDMRTILPGVIKRSSFIITNTNATADSLRKIYPEYTLPFVIARIPPVAAVKLSKKEAGERITRLGIDTSFILFHATLEPRKNLSGLIEAYSLLPKEIRSKYALVVSGGKGWKDKGIEETFANAAAKDLNIHRLGYTSDEDRAALFMNAKVYVLPSFYEGFGMQLLEAFTYKTPTIASAIPVLKEVGGDACLYADVNADALKVAILQIITDKELRSALVARGENQLKKYSWDTVAAEVFAQIKSSLKQ